jgi:hypothetical protein
VHPLALLLEHLGHRMLSEPVDLKVRVPGPKFTGDGQVRHDPVLVAVHDQDRAAHLPADGLSIRLGEHAHRRASQQQRLGGGLQPGDRPTRPDDD